jgi:hypothetical protein
MFDPSSILDVTQPTIEIPRRQIPARKYSHPSSLDTNRDRSLWFLKPLARRLVMKLQADSLYFCRICHGPISIRLRSGITQNENEEVAHEACCVSWIAPPEAERVGYDDAQ